MSKGGYSDPFLQPDAFCLSSCLRNVTAVNEQFCLLLPGVQGGKGPQQHISPQRVRVQPPPKRAPGQLRDMQLEKGNRFVTSCLTVSPQGRAEEHLWAQQIRLHY